MRIDSGTPSQLPPAGGNDGDGNLQTNAQNKANGSDAQGESALDTIRQGTLVHLRPPRRAPGARPKHGARKARNPKAGQRSVPGDKRTPAERSIDSAASVFKQRIGERAHDKQGFHDMMKQVYGARYDESKVEALRQRALSGDFSFLPKARFVDSATLNGNYAAYDAQSGTILLNESLRGQPQKLVDYYTEEAGHHIDTLLGAGDAVGDEGELLRNVLAGNELSNEELAAIRAEDDTGTITVDGKEIEVEFGFLKKIFKGAKKAIKGVAKGIKKGVGKVWKGVKKVAGKVWDGIKKAGKWLMTSTIGNYVLTAALAVFSVVTAGAGTAAMIAWEAAKQAAFAVAKSVIVQKATGFIAKVSGSETLGRIAGAVGGALAGGKFNFSSTGTFVRTAGTVAKDIAVNEAKRVVKDKVISKIDSPFLQMAAGYAVNAGIDAGANYVSGKVSDALYPKDKDKTMTKDKALDNTDKAAKTEDSDEGYDLDVRKYAGKAIDAVGKITLDDISKMAPKELRYVLSAVAGNGIKSITVAELAAAAKRGLNNFAGMSGEDVAAALQDYTRNALSKLGEIDAGDVSRFASDAFDQAGNLKLDPLLRLAGIEKAGSDASVARLAEAAGTSADKLTIGDVLALVARTDDDADTPRPTARQAAG